MRLRLILVAAAAATLSGCIHPIDTADAPSFGQSVAAMVTAQTEPVQATDEPPQSSGAVGARAVDAYANGTPQQPDTVNLNISTTSD
jgi:hypothetical protein